MRSRAVMRVLLPVALATACTVGPTRQQLLAPLVGVSEADLVARMGVPNRTYDVGRTKFLAYEDRRVDVVPGFAPSPAFGPWWNGYPTGFYGGGFPPEVYLRSCETTFEIVGGRVRFFSLRGNDCG